MTKVGDKLWYQPRYDANRRELSSYRCVEIVGETKQSWLIHSYGPKERVNKKTLKGSPDKYSSGIPYYASLDEVKEMLWIDKHCHRIADEVRHVRDGDLLRKIAELIGYKEEVE